MNIITKLNIRQKIMLTLTVLAAAFLAWQIYNFVHADAPSAKPLASAPASVPTPAAVTPPTPQQLPPQSLGNAQLTYSQKEYLNLVREYQMTKMKRQIVEEAASLATAQKRIADAGRNNSLLGVDHWAGDNFRDGSAYQLSYLDRQAGQWMATISQAGQYQEVHVGSRLADGSKIVAINNRGVTLLSAKGKRLILGFQGSINVENASSAAKKKAAPKKKLEVSKTTAPVEQKPELAPSPAVTSSESNPDKVKIAKMLGITKAPSDVSAAPLEGSQEAPPSAAPTSEKSADAITGPITTNDPAPQEEQNSSVIMKPVSVRDLRQQSGQAKDSIQITVTGEQADRLGAMLSS